MLFPTTLFLWVSPEALVSLALSRSSSSTASWPQLSSLPSPLSVTQPALTAREAVVDYLFKEFSLSLSPTTGTSPKSKSLSSTDTFGKCSIICLFCESPRFVSLLGQFDVQRFVSEVKKSEGFVRGSSSTAASRFNTITKHLKDKSLYALGFCSELLLTPDDTLLLSYDTYKGDLQKNHRAKAVFNHKAIPLFTLFCFLVILSIFPNVISY